LTPNTFASLIRGDQFNYSLNKDGSLSRNSRETLATGDFLAMLDAVEAGLMGMGRQVYAGVAKIDPYRKGLMTACDQCDYRSICRIDPWTHNYRVLRKIGEEEQS
jgi:ATP-dependent helicase/nuclease subunit B